MKATEMFVVIALILLVFALIARFTSVSSLGVGITWGGTGYSLPPSFICIVLATMLCFVASVYSLWMLPFNRMATWWHFWLTGTKAGPAQTQLEQSARREFECNREWVLKKSLIA